MAPLRAPAAARAPLAAGPPALLSRAPRAPRAPPPALRRAPPRLPRALPRCGAAAAAVRLLLGRGARRASPGPAGRRRAAPQQLSAEVAVGTECKPLGQSSLCYIGLAVVSLGLIATVLTRWSAQGFFAKGTIVLFVLEIMCIMFEFTLNGFSNLLYTSGFSQTLRALYGFVYALLPWMPLAAFLRIRAIADVRGLGQLPWLSAAWLATASLSAALVAADLVLKWMGRGAKLHCVVKPTEARVAYAMRYSGVHFLLALVPSMLVLLQMLLTAAAAAAAGQGLALALGAAGALWLCSSRPGSPLQGAGEVLLEATYLVGLRL